MQAPGNAAALTITPAPLSVVGVATTPRPYDGTTVDALSGATISGTFYNGDAPTLTNASTGTLGNNGNVGTDSVTTSMGLTGTGSGNYALTQPTGLTAVISPLGLTATSTVTKSYDGGTVASLAGANTVLSGFVAGQGATVNSGVTGSFASANVGSGIAITGGALSAGNLTPVNGTLLSNYTLPSSDNGTGTITPAVINLSGSRVYDAATDAAASIFNGGTVNGVAGQTLTLSGQGTLASKNVGSESVSLGTLALGDGTGAASNYTLVGGTDTVSVSKYAIIVSAAANNKTYNGNTTATLASLNSSGVLSGDSIAFHDTSATFSDKNVGTAKLVSVAGISATGADKNNYSFNATTTSTADITPYVLTLAGTRVYDTSSNAPAGAFGTAGLVTGVGSETLQLTGSGTLAGANVGSQSVSALGTLAIGTGGTGTASNYTLVGGSDTVSVTPATLVYTANSASSVYGTSPVTQGGAVSGFVGADTLGSATTGNAAFSTTATSASNVGYYAINGSGLTADNGNYVFSQAAGNATALTVHPAVINLSGARTYDAATDAAASIFGSSGTLSTGIGTQTITLQGTGVLASKNVGSESVTALGSLSLANGTGLASNYTLVGGSDAVSVAARGITVAATASNKAYDGTAAATLTALGSAGVLSGDTVTFASQPASFADKNAGSGKTVTVTGITDSGADAGNYTLNNSSAVTTATIAPLAITVSGTANNKTYDGTQAAAVATLGSSGVLAGDTVSFTDSGATFANKNVGAGKTVTISGISASGADANNYSFAATTAATASISPLAITVTGAAANKVYDGTTAAGATLSSAGLISGDAVNFSDTSATFADKNVATGKTVSISGISDSGADSGNYTLNNSTATALANITPRSITVVGTANNKTYDSTTSATVATLSSAGLVSGDAVTFTDSSATFANKNAGVGKTVTISGISDSGADSGNYTLTGTTASTTATIAPLGITVSGSAANKVYDGTTAATLTALTSAGVLGSDVVSFSDSSANFADKNAGTGKTVTISGIAKSGADAGNYSLNNTTAGTAADITPLGITVSGTAANKVYDGTTAATVASLSSAGLISGDVVSFSDSAASFADKNAGTGKSVTISGIAKTGADAGNYSLNNTSTSTLANIAMRGITVAGTAADKVYDGSTTATVTKLTSTGIVAADDVSFSNSTANFADKNAGTGKTVTIGGISESGADSGNYVLNNTTATTTAAIAPLGLTVTGTAANKVYDGSTAATVTNLTSTGILGTDAVSFTSSSASFADKNAGTGKTVTIGGISDTGADSSNYVLNNTTATTSATIAPLAITVSGTAANKVYDGGTVASISTLSAAGVLPGDTVAFTDGAANFADKNVGTGKTVSIVGISATGSDAPNYTLTSTSTAATANITPLAITVTGTATNKTYDGTSAASVASLGSAAVIAGDAVSFSDAGADFADKNAGVGKTVTITGISQSGADAANYTLSNTTALATANISPLAISVTGTANDKTYDGTTAATVGGLTSTGVLGSDVVAFRDGAASFADKNAGTGKTVTIAGISSWGPDAANYTLSNTTALTTASITPLAVTVTGTANNKTYDGNVLATVASLGSSAILSGDAVTFAAGSATFADKNAGAAKTVTLAGITASGADALNYALNNTVATATASINPLAITVIGTAADKIYDATTAATVATLTSAGVVSGDNVSFASTGASFSDKNVGSGKTVSIAGISAGGADALNYTLNNGSAQTTASIDPRPITVVGTVGNKVYDGNTAASVASLSSAGVLGGDAVSFADTSASFADKNAGTGKTVTIGGISALGGDAANYSWNSTALTQANINPLSIAVSASALDKTYDGSTSATVSRLTSSGILSGDSVVFADGNANFNDKNVGSAKTVTISGISESGTDAGNYALFNTTAVTSASINPRSITVVGAASDKVYDGTSTASLSSLNSSGVVAGDAITFSDSSAAFLSKDVGSAKPVLISGITASGADAGNYLLSNSRASTTASITPLAITVSGTANGKVYDGSAGAVVTALTASGVLAGDTVSFSDGGVVFADKNVGTGKTVTISGIVAAGSDAGDYSLNNTTTTPRRYHAGHADACGHTGQHLHWSSGAIEGHGVRVRRRR